MLSLQLQDCDWAACLRASSASSQILIMEGQFPQRLGACTGFWQEFGMPSCPKMPP